jgi:chemotaxis protein MotB
MTDHLNLENGSKSSRDRLGGHAEEPRDRWLISYADLMTLLLALFIVLYAAADHKRASKIASAIADEFGKSGSGPATGGKGVLPGTDSLMPSKAGIEKAFLMNQKLKDRARVTDNERGLVVSLTEAGFFPPADASIRPDALPLLDDIADALRQSDAQVRVEGHTDSLRISTSRFPSNWELSAARAASVVAYLSQHGVASSRLSVAGFADERPVADNSTPEGRAQNRRVDIVVMGTER